MLLDRRPLRIASVLALSALLATCRTPDGAAQGMEPAPRVVASRPWEMERSDVPVDPRIRFGALDNGLRYAWAANPEPKERVYLRLHVDVGSYAEEENERGLAHFLEHMAFNGSKNFPAGTLIEWFQRHGMSFGADTNAHTSFSETVYKLDLPNADAATIREGLKVLRDFADGLLLAAEEIEREKGVIDGEQRERDSAAWRVQVKQLETLFAGTRVPERLPIGTAEIRALFTAESVRAFYEKWYRP
ncbi:MAG: pitrilysin family protein, partial [Planctomycetota bacterium]